MLPIGFTAERHLRSLDRSCCRGMMEPKLMEVGSRENGKRGSRASRYRQLLIEVSL